MLASVKDLCGKSEFSTFDGTLIIVSLPLCGIKTTYLIAYERKYGKL